MNKIMVCGGEDFTLGFELVGIEAKPMEEFESLLSKNLDIGIIVIDQEEYNKLSLKLKNQITRLLKPIVLILSKDDIKGGNLKEAIIKALGVDLLK